MDRHVKTSYLIGLVIVLAIIAGLLLSLSDLAKEKKILSISSYADCVAAGYPVMESYPSRCTTPDGRTFVNPSQHVELPVMDVSTSGTTTATTTQR